MTNEDLEKQALTIAERFQDSFLYNYPGHDQGEKPLLRDMILESLHHVWDRAIDEAAKLALNCSIDDLGPNGVAGVIAEDILTMKLKKEMPCEK